MLLQRPVLLHPHHILVVNPFLVTTCAHMPIGNMSRVQNWTRPDNKIGIQFTYRPEKPIINAFTELKFSVQNTTTGQHISDTEDAVARVVVTNRQRLFKNISVGDGHISVKYLFPDDGTHQAITRLDTKNSVNLALFLFPYHISLLVCHFLPLLQQQRCQIALSKYDCYNSRWHK
jgi:hypothetical protein